MRHKVYNNNDYNIGIRLENPSRELNIRANTYISMNEEDILYTNSVSTLFSSGQLYVESQDLLEEMGYIEKNPNSIGKDEIKEILKSGNSRIKREFSKLTEQHAVRKVITVIGENQEELDLSQSAIKIINDTLKIDINNILAEEVNEKETN